MGRSRRFSPSVLFSAFGLALLLMLGVTPPLKADSPHTDPDHPHLPGELGPDDTRVLIYQAPGQPPGTSSARVLFTPEFQDFFVTFTVYRHAYGDDLPFERGVFLPLSSCTLSQADYEVGNLGSCPGWGKDALYGYLAYTDPTLTDYEEYSYLVHSSEDGVDDPDEFLEGYVVVRAFPPTQTRHGNYAEYTDACTACHGLHSSQNQRLLKAPSITDLCATCHDGTGSKYDEVRGLVRRGPAWSSAAYAAAGPFGDALKPGSGLTTTSVHSVTRSVSCSEGGDSQTCGTEWGLDADRMARIWMAPGSGWTREAGAKETNDEGNRVYRLVTTTWSSWLSCTSCHEPHDRGKNFRILRPVINDRTNILLRGVSEVVLDFGDSHPDRGVWERRAMYTKFLSGGNSVLTFYTPRVEDPGELSGKDEDPPNGLDDGAESACLEEKGEIEVDPSSPSGYRCLVKRGMGGVTSFCTACHRTFMWPEAWVAKESFPDPYDPGSGKTYSGMNQAETTPGSFVPPEADLNQSWGRHKHPMAIKPMEAALEGRLVDGTLARDGDICSFRKLSNGDARCRDVDQWRVRDPVVPLEGKEKGADTVVTLDGIGLSPGWDTWANAYSQGNIIMCLTCHVAHGSGSDKLQVAYKNFGLNDTSDPLLRRNPDTNYLEVLEDPYPPGTRPSGPYWWENPQNLVSSALARFQPLASVCFRCHSMLDYNRAYSLGLVED